MKTAVTALLAILGVACAAPALDATESSNLPGLNSTQTTNARDIISEVKKENVGTQGCRAAITWALLWSDLLNYANPSVPKSLKYHHDAVGGSDDSLGVFQWRTSFYPDIAELMNPTNATGIFISQMKEIKGWKTMNVGVLCEDIVREGAYRFERYLPAAEKICSAEGL